MTEAQSVEERVCLLVAMELGVSTGVNREQKLAADLGADSLDFVEIIMAVEEEFGFEVSDEDVDQHRLTETVGNLINYVENRVQD